MKKQINSVTILSVKNRIAVTVLCAFLGATEVNANNYSSAALHTISKEIKSEVKNENGMNRTTAPWVSQNSREVVKEQITDVIAQWMADSSYWSSEDSVTNDQNESEKNVKTVTTTQCTGHFQGENKPYVFNAESYIPNSEF